MKWYISSVKEHVHEVVYIKCKVVSIYTPCTGKTYNCIHNCANAHKHTPKHVHTCVRTCMQKQLLYMYMYLWGIQVHTSRLDTEGQFCSS